MSRKRIAVAMSGGVDSSVTAALLKNEGYELVGVTMRIWPADDSEKLNVKPGRTENEARMVADRLGIEHHVFDVTDQFSKCIFSEFVEEYRRGHTPNPCARCNPRIKFGALLEYAISSLGADALATGHYARVVRDEKTGLWKLLRGVDRSKDQSYVLYRLNQDQLARVIMPLGSHAKSEVRNIAESYGFDIPREHESQDICFIPGERYQDFLKRQVPDLTHPGPIVDTEGSVLGEHEGIAFYTIGQRKGLGVASGKRLYVVAIDAESNTVVLGSADKLVRRSLVVKEMVLVSGQALEESIVVSAKIRYNTQDSKAYVRPLRLGWAVVEFEHEQRAVTPGQSTVFYKDEEVIGGGIIADDRETRNALVSEENTT